MPSVRTLLSYGTASRVRSLLTIAGVWMAVAVICTLQAFTFSLYREEPQDWWPSLGYTAAIFSVWAILTPTILCAGRWLVGSPLSQARRAGLVLVGLPTAIVLHLLLFVTLFWPVYGGNASSPFAMVMPVLAANLDKSVLAYAALLTVIRFRRSTPRTLPAEPYLQTNGPLADDGLWIRTSGTLRLVLYRDIDWIAAAGDYAEVVVAGQRLLVDRSLADLATALPSNEFARIHRGAIIRLDRMRQVNGLGRGDASIVLDTGETVRLSRRYRKNLADHIPM